MKGAWRCFVSVAIGDELRASLTAALDGWRKRADLDGIVWTDPAAWHLTLAFLGDTAPAAVDTLTARLGAAAARHEPFELPTGGLGGFPSDGRARVAWYGVDDAHAHLARLADDVGRAVDLEPDRPFTAHVTLGRARRDRVDLRQWIRESNAPGGLLAVTTVELMRSIAGRGPAHYETLASVPLGGPLGD